MTHRDLNEAVSLFTNRYREQRRHTPNLPARHEDPQQILPLLQDLLEKSSGVVAVDGNRLCGYLIGMVVTELKGIQKGVYVPEWSHSAQPEGSTSIYQRMYESLAANWVGKGCYSQAVTVFAHDLALKEMWFKYAFGMLVTDAIRPIEPPLEAPMAEGIAIRRATPADAGVALSLAQELESYLAGSPIFLGGRRQENAEDKERWLSNQQNAIFLAIHQGKAVAYLKGQTAEGNACHVVTDPKTLAVTGAYTMPAFWGKGIATALLNVMLTWGRDQGYQQSSVDFETQNVSGSRFWHRHFQPVCHSLIRRVDERVGLHMAQSESG